MTSTKTIKIQGQTFTLEYPNVGQFIDIKVLETKLSQGTIAQLAMGTPGQVDALLFITTYAHFIVLCPELMKKLKVDNLLDLSIKDFEEMSKCYLEEIQPWLSGIKEEIKEGMNETRQKP